jgi:hypothetical protein
MEGLSGIQIRVFLSSWKEILKAKHMRNPMKKCEFCDEEFVPKRTDTRFCGRKCQSTSNNRAKAMDEKYLKSIIKVIKKNRTILKQIFEDSKITDNVVPSAYLIDCGFKLGYVTMIMLSQDSNVELHVVGDYSIRKVSEDKFKVEQNDRF